MSKLIVNVWVKDQGWGPGFGNADQVPADVAAEIDDPDVWDTPPAKSPSNQSAGSIPASPEAAPVAPETPAEPAPRLTPASKALADLALVPDDKEALIVFRDAHGLDVDGRLGAEKLRAGIAEALGG